MRFIFRYIKYICYRLYTWQCGIQPTEQFAAHIALVVMVLLSVLYLFVFASIVGFFYPQVLTLFGQYSTYFFILYFIVGGAVPYFMNVRDGRYKNIISPFHNLYETRTQKWMRGGMIIINVLCLFLIIVIFAVIHRR